MNNLKHRITAVNSSMPHCAVCRLSASNLTTLCPGKHIQPSNTKLIAQAKLDFNQHGWVSTTKITDSEINPITSRINSNNKESERYTVTGRIKNDSPNIQDLPDAPQKRAKAIAHIIADALGVNSVEIDLSNVARDNQTNDVDLTDLDDEKEEVTIEDVTSRLYYISTLCIIAGAYLDKQPLNIHQLDPRETIYELQFYGLVSISEGGLLNTTPKADKYIGNLLSFSFEV